MPADIEPCMCGSATFVTLVSSTCMTVTIITDIVMAHRRAGEIGSSVTWRHYRAAAGRSSTAFPVDSGWKLCRPPGGSTKTAVFRALRPWHSGCSDQRPMRGKSTSRTSTGPVAIAGADDFYSRRLVQTLRSGNGSRPVRAITAGRDLAAEVAASTPSVIVFDLGRNPDARGLATIATLSRLAKTIVVSPVDSDSLAVEALKAGAAGFCPRDTPTALLRRAIELVEAGEIWISRRVMLRLIEELAVRAAPPAVAGGEQLTPRECDLVNLVAAGASNKAVAERLSISVKTVKTHLTSIFKKLGLSSRLELAVAIGRSAPAPTNVG